MTTALTHQRDPSIPHREPGVRHLPHQGVEPDTPVAAVCRCDHHYPCQVYARNRDSVGPVP